MVVHRLPGELQAEVPTSVYALDLQRLSQLLGIDEEELVSGFHSHPTLSEMHGVIVDAGEDVPFEAIEKRGLETLNDHETEATIAHDSPQRLSSFVFANELQPVLPIHVSTPPPSSIPIHDRRLCKQALITAATRTTSLDVDGIPKCLIPLGSQTIISHILTQLYAAGIERIVISVAESGRQIMDAVKQTPFYAKMVIEFMDLGEENKDGHARSILAAREYFKRGPFLIHTSDHIFDKTIITKFMNYQLNENVACVLVETDIRQLVGLPSTTVKVQLGREKIRRIGRDVLQYDGIDAGLFLSSTAIFDALEELTTKKSYFSLADALSYFTKYNKLTYVATAGETWFSIETQEQLAFTQDHEGKQVLSPWTVFLATVPPQQSVMQQKSTSKSSQNLVIGISAVDRDASLRVVGTNDPKKLFDGFVVGVTNADRRDEEMLALSSETPDGRHDDSLFPLLANRAQSFISSSKGAGSTRSMLLSRETSFIEQGAVEDSFVISFPVDDEMSQTIDNLSSSQYAYLIEMNPDPTTPAGTNAQFMLAVPGTTAVTSTPKTRSSHATPILEGLRRRDLLPSDIEHISLETRGYDEHLEVSVVVTRKVPLIGYILLGAALLTISSVAVALDMEANVAPLLKLFWRNCGTCMVTFPLALYSIRRNGRPEVTLDLIFSMILAGAAYGFYLGAYVVSLSLTTVAHSTLFNNAHSLLIVMFKLVTGQPVQLLEGVGTAIGLMGGIVTTMDVPAKVTTQVAQDIVGPSVAGDLVALLGAAGGATYFIVAKKLRPKMDLIVFMCGLTFVSGVCLLLTLIATGQKITLSTDENHGILGWINPTPTRLLLAFYLVFICDLCGNMGYISVMKYFDPLVVSVVCLLEPIIADVLAILLGFDTIPGLLTFIGGALVIGGTFLVIKTQGRKTEQHDATVAIKSAVSQSGIGGMTPKPLYSARTHRSGHTYGSLN